MAQSPYEIEGKRVFVAGHGGMVGAAICRRLDQENCEIQTATRSQLDLRDQTAVRDYLAETKPHTVILAAARVGGIWANDAYPADFLYDNLVIETNVVEGAFRVGVEKLLFLGSSCIYPKFAPQPIPEEALLTGPLEPTNEWYAIAKIAGLKLCEAYRKQHGCDFISAMPTNLYGPGDNFHLENSHVIPGLLRKAHEAKLRDEQNLAIWGTGAARREFLHVDDCADALLFLLKNYSDAMHVNVGAGSDISIADLARQIMDVVGLKGKLELDPTKPDGTPRKLMDGEKLASFGWLPAITLQNGLADTYRWFLEHQADARLG
ncbi:MAG: GDP-L-fucose synthase [Pseudomonadota bacterium]